MYFLRLAKLKPAVEAVAVEAWEGFSVQSPSHLVPAAVSCVLTLCGLQIAGEHARRVERVLDVRQGELCWVAGTIYMEMPLKPNILDDLAKDAS
jgi:DNA polymerase delta subunit 2